MSCSVCLEARAWATCRECDTTVCRACARRGALEHVHDAACVACGREWTSTSPWPSRRD